METKELNNRQPLVSIITPCYNGEKFIYHFLNSVLGQSYSNIELIFINDGSTDNTEGAVLSYKDRFEEKGIDFKYIYQENGGQAAALNQGLKIFRGKYLTWPDSDDILHKDNIADRVSFLENNKDYDIVLCACAFINGDKKRIDSLKRNVKEDEDDLFSDLILENNIYFAGGAYMVRTSFFVKRVPNRSIYESRGGQNWQMLLPVLYKNKCGYVNRELYYIYVRNESHSRSLTDYYSNILRCDEHKSILINTINAIKEMPMQEKRNWKSIIENKYLKRKLIIASQYRNKLELDRFYMEIQNKDIGRFYDTIIYLKGKYILVSYMIKVITAPIRLISKLRRYIYD